MRATRASCFIVVLLCAASAGADGVCEKDFRDTTAEERVAMTRVLETVKAALPPAPEGWAIGGYEIISVPQRLCKDAETAPIGYTLSRTYNRVDNLEERQRELEQQGAAAKQALAEGQPTLDALMARMQSLSAELASAAQSGDQAKIDAINAELEQVSKQLETVTNRQAAQIDAGAVAQAMRDVEMSIAAAVNSGAVSTDGRERMAAPAGAREAFRWQTTADGVPTAHALVLVGSWQARDGGGLAPAPRAGAPSAAAQAIRVELSADPARIDALLGGIDFAAVNALVR